MRVVDIYRLTPMQQGILFHSVADPESNLYIVQLKLRLRGPVDVTALREAWLHLTQRHAALRTTFAWEDVSHPVQLVLSDLDVVFDVYPRADTRPTADEIVAADRRRGIALDSPPLWRVLLIEEAQDDHLLVWTHHHAMLDGWSCSIIIGELAKAYRAARAGRDTPLPLNPSFSEYVSWLAAIDSSSATTYWTELLRGYEPRAVASREGIRSVSNNGPTHADLELAYDSHRQDRWILGARNAQVSFSTLANGAWATTVAREVGTDDVVHGTTVSGRSPEFPHSERIVGVCINTLPVRTIIPRDAHVKPWLGLLHRATAERLSHEHISLQRIFEAGTTTAGMAFDTILSVENYPQENRPVDGSDADVTFRYEGVIESTNYPVVATVPPERALLKITYDRSALEKVRAERLLEGWAANMDYLADAGTTSRVRPIAARGLPQAPGAVVEGAKRARGSFTESQEVVARAWRKVLQRDDIRLDDNFFDVGGTSLLMFSLLRVIRAETGLPLRMVDLFAHPTVAGLASCIDDSVKPTPKPTRAQARLERLGHRRAER